MREQLSKYEIRLRMIKECQKKIDSFELKINLPESLLDSLTFSYDNLQNDPALISAFKESVFLARELMDIIIKKLAYEFKGTISNDFTKFMIGLANGNYSKLDSRCLDILSQQKVIKGFILLREIRNKMKNNLDLTFHCMNRKDLELTFQLNTPNKLREKILNFDEIMDIKNRAQVTKDSNVKIINQQIFPKNFIKDIILLFETLKETCEFK